MGLITEELRVPGIEAGFGHISAIALAETLSDLPPDLLRGTEIMAALVYCDQAGSIDEAPGVARFGYVLRGTVENVPRTIPDPSRPGLNGVFTIQQTHFLSGIDIAAGQCSLTADYGLAPRIVRPGVLHLLDGIVSGGSEHYAWARHLFFCKSKDNL